MFSSRILKSTAMILLAGCTAFAQTAAKTAPAKTPGKTSTSYAKGAATVAEAQAFMKKAEDQLLDLNVRASRAGWVQENFITDDTETMSAQANEKLTAVVTQLALADCSKSRRASAYSRAASIASAMRCAKSCAHSMSLRSYACGALR